ncbi:TonB-dependent receptor domain-containing protein [Pistricoccus aurantiacus]|nr:TonB-dependent receptor [Pistricoccus aurantiacus]
MIIHKIPGLSMLAVSCLCLTPLAAALAQTAPSARQASQSAQAVALNPLTVTATLAPRTANQTLSSISVIDQEDLHRKNPASLTDILRGQPGVDVSSNGDFGKVSSVYIRGAGSSSTLMLIDGIRLRSATVGSPTWQYLDPNLFERAEILRGPKGSLYGADAVGGVVQLFLPEGEGEPTPRISVGGGSFNTQRYSAGLSGANGGTRYHFAASRLDTDGTEIKKGDDDKGYDNTSGVVRLSHRFDNDAEIGLLGLRARGSTEYVGGRTDYVQQVAGIYGELPIVESVTSRLTLSEARDESDEFADFGDATFDTRTRTARLDNTLSLGPYELIVGAEYSEDEVDSTTAYEEDSRDNKAVFAQGLLDFDPLTMQAGLRYDDNQAFGSEVTGSLGLGYALNEHHTLRASYGTAFRAPTFNELYFPGFGNPDLDPERSKTAELGIRGQFARAFWDLALYQTDIDDQIATTLQGGRFAPFNVNRARIRGVELTTGAEVKHWELQAALTYMDPEDRDSGNRLPLRASRSIRLDADRELGDWSLGGSFIAQNHRYNGLDNDERLSGFGIVDLRAGWRFAPLWTARLTVENVLDKEYATARASEFEGGWDYLNPGRAAYLSVQFGE